MALFLIFPILKVPNLGMACRHINAACAPDVLKQIMMYQIYLNLESNFVFDARNTSLLGKYVKVVVERMCLVYLTPHHLIPK